MYFCNLQGKRMKSCSLTPSGGVLPAELILCSVLSLKRSFKILEHNSLV